MKIYIYQDCEIVHRGEKLRLKRDSVWIIRDSTAKQLVVEGKAGRVRIRRGRAAPSLIVSPAGIPARVPEPEFVEEVVNTVGDEEDTETPIEGTNTPAGEEE